MLDAKLNEEILEYQESKSLEELADLLEVIDAVVRARGYSWEELSALRKKKNSDRGGFEKRILLKSVTHASEAESLTERICRNKNEILEKISVSMLEKYCWLEENLHKCDVSTNTEYQQHFSHFYRMRFVSQEYREAFFALFERIKTNPEASFEDVARHLYRIDNRHEFSFITKMLHTINTTRPIYDSQVNAALNLRTYQAEFEKKLKMDSLILEKISNQYRILMEAPEITAIQKEIEKRISPRTISTEKKLDFILWALGGK
jgi:hypothetical protein